MSGEGSLADLLAGVRWDYDPRRQEVSPLLPTARYFQDFPWDGEEPAAEPAPGQSPPRNSPIEASGSL